MGVRGIQINVEGTDSEGYAAQFKFAGKVKWDVEGDFETTVQGNQKTTIQGNRTITIGGNDKRTSNAGMSDEAPMINHN